MSFAHGEMLYLIWVAPLLLGLCIWGFRRRQALLRQFASERALSSIAPNASNRRRMVKIALRLLAVLALAVALAGVRYGYTWETVERRGVDLVVALDCSKSMLADDIAPNRLERAKRKIRDLLGLIEGDKVGLVAFAGTSFLQCPLTLDYGGFDLFLNALEPDFLPVGGTDLAGAIRTSLQAFDPKDNAERAIILITDGESTTPGAIDAAREAAEQKVKISCVGIGSPEGAPIPDGRGGFRKDKAGGIVHSRLDEDTLQKIAALTGGTYVRSVTGDVDLEAIYRDIRASLEAKTLQSGRIQIYQDRFRIFVGLALAALLLDLLLPARARRRQNGNGTGVSQAFGTSGTALALLCLLVLPGAPALAASPSTLAGQGLAAWQGEDYEAALKAYLDAQVQEPDNPTLSYNVGNAQYRLNRFEEARQNFLAAAERLDKAESPQDRALKASALYNAGNASFRQDDLQGAVTHYEEALKHAPDDAQITDNLAFVRKQLEQQQQQQQENQQCEQSGDQQQQESQQSGQNKGESAGQDRASSGQQGQQGGKGQQDQHGQQDEMQPGEQSGSAQNEPRQAENDKPGEGQSGDAREQAEPSEQSAAGRPGATDATPRQRRPRPTSRGRRPSTPNPSTARTYTPRVAAARAAPRERARRTRPPGRRKPGPRTPLRPWMRECSTVSRTSPVAD